MISIGSELPEMTFSRLVNGEMTNPHTNEIFDNKKILLFAVPGAFTPTCSHSHLPGYVEKLAEFKAKGIDEVICTSVNDAFVMDAWAKSLNAEGVVMLADGNGAFAEAIGLDMDTDSFGGIRSQRYAMLVEDGKVSVLNVEDPGRFEVSDAESMLKAI